MRWKYQPYAWLVTFLLSYAICPKSLQADQDSEQDLTIGERFHKETSVTWKGIIADLFRSKPKAPKQFKTYPEALRTKLPDPDFQGMSVEEALKKRRSDRNYSQKSMSLSELSQLLWSAQGVTGESYGSYLRPAPSAGALYPFEIYVVAMNVDSLEQGIYHYALRTHELELIKKGDFRDEISDAALEQEMMGEANVTFIMSAIFDRTRSKYGDRGFRYIYMEAGHISQNLYLQAISLGLGSVAVGAFHDDETNELIEVDGKKEAAIYMQAIGTK